MLRAQLRPLLQIPFSTTIEETVEQILQARGQGIRFPEGGDAQPMVRLWNTGEHTLKNGLLREVEHVVPLPLGDLHPIGLSVSMPWASSGGPANVIHDVEKKNALVDGEPGI